MYIKAYIYPYLCVCVCLMKVRERERDGRGRWREGDGEREMCEDDAVLEDDAFEKKINSPVGLFAFTSFVCCFWLLFFSGFLLFLVFFSFGFYFA